MPQRPPPSSSALAPRLHRWVWVLWVLAMLGLPTAPAWAQAEPPAAVSGPAAGGAPTLLVDGRQPLRADPAEGEVDLWPGVRWREEPAGAGWSPQRALQDGIAAFQVPPTPHANLGLRRNPVWLRVALAGPGPTQGRWLLHIDYPSLDQVDVYAVRAGQVRWLGRMGDRQPLVDRPVRARSHLLPLPPLDGQPLDLLLRVETTSTMMVPLQLVTAQVYAEAEARLQIAQGVVAGMGLFLVLYSLAQALVLRDSGFAYYALSAVATTLFSLSFIGLAGQHLWPDHPWMVQNAAPLWVLLAEMGAALFIDRALRVAQIRPRLSLALQATGALAGLGALGFTAGLIDYRSTHALGTLLGTTPILFGLPAAWIRMRAGDRAAQYIVAGWAVYAVGIVVLAGLLRGWVGIGFWSRYAFQASSVLEMMVWLLALGARVQAIREAADEAHKERALMHALAHTDPLTGLPNRRALDEHLAVAVAAARPQAPLAVFLGDLDGFKAVNDRLGHETGDLLLQAVALRLRAAVRPGDLVVRLGGDEFVVVAHGLGGRTEADAIGDRLQGAFAEPFLIRGQALRVGLTLGMALGEGAGHEAAQLLMQADAAMYAAKPSGRHSRE